MIFAAQMRVHHNLLTASFGKRPNPSIEGTCLTFRRSRSQYGANFPSLCEGTKRLGRDAQQSE